jgi:alkylated DNA repair dioxygenase AlkB
MALNLNFSGNTVNLLPFDGEAWYFNGLLKLQESNQYYNALLKTILWKHDEVMIFGKHLVTKRKMAWYAIGDIPYKYSNLTRTALPFTKELFALKALAESISGESFNACLLNLYQDGSEGMGWHSDDEKSIIPNSAIASISLGCKRKFVFRHKKTRETIPVELENGSLLVMKGSTQVHWQHALPKLKRVTEPRINLTFRNMVDTSMT